MSSASESNVREILPQRIAAERVRMGLSQGELSQRVSGKPRAATCSDWETGKTTPDAVTLDRLAEVFGVSADYLLGREDVQKPAPRGEERAVSVEPIADAERLELLGMISDVQAALAKGRGKGKAGGSSGGGQYAPIPPSDLTEADVVRKRGNG